MALPQLHIITLLISLAILLLQLMVKNKKSAHILFALFAGSIAILAAKQLSSEHIGNYKYLIGMTACITCNGYWLLSRSLFRSKNSITLPHILIAIVIALLIMAQQGYLFVNYELIGSSDTQSFVQYALSELTVLLSSCVLVLSFWEGCRGYKADTTIGKAQRFLFLTTFGLAVVITKTSNGLLINDAQNREFITYLVMLFVVINTQILMWWKFSFSNNRASEINEIANLTTAQLNSQAQTPVNKLLSESDMELVKNVKNLLITQQYFLKANLKVADIARELNQPEYKISKALRHDLKANHFNQYVNELRIEYSKVLLADPDKNKWPILVIGLESGFASIGPFTRTFKTLTGCTPNQYRQSQI